MVIVKKYGNRRLYDTEASRYVTMEELSERVRGGVDVKVIDASTNEDLTQATLTQIIIEGRGAARLLAVPLLTQLIRMGDDALAEFFGRYVTWALEVYLTTKQTARALGPLNPFPFIGNNPLLRMISGGGAWDGASPPAAPPAPAPAAPPAPAAHAAHAPPPDGEPPPNFVEKYTAIDVAELRMELEELKKALQQKKPKKRAQKR